jgi:hypothetical protein
MLCHPPYNKSKGNVYKGGHGGKSLWDKFVLFTLENFLVEYGVCGGIIEKCGMDKEITFWLCHSGV